MARLIQGYDCEESFRNSCAFLLTQPKWRSENLIVEISNPSDLTRLPYCLANRSPHRIKTGGDNIRHVMNTIFPMGLWTHFSNRQDFYEKYLTIFCSSTNARWGTYFKRLINLGRDCSSDYSNQLENIIQAFLGSAPQKHFATMHITAANIESNVRLLGAPCLQFIQVNKADNNRLNMVAVYRNHDYFNKALGNFYGLAHLLQFICDQTQYLPGRLVIHSIHAFTSSNKSQFEAISL